jgi:hypothetical protein
VRQATRPGDGEEPTFKLLRFPQLAHVAKGAQEDFLNDIGRIRLLDCGEGQTAPHHPQPVVSEQLRFRATIPLLDPLDKEDCSFFHAHLSYMTPMRL